MRNGVNVFTGDSLFFVSHEKSVMDRGFNVRTVIFKGRIVLGISFLYFKINKKTDKQKIGTVVPIFLYHIKSRF